MRVLDIKVNENLNITDKLAACIGYFDGFHLGHQGLFKQTLKAARERSLKSALITFDPDPWVVLKGIKDVTHISTMNDRKVWAEEMGFDYFLVLNFSKEMASLSPKSFVDELLINNNIKYLVCGFDFHFGDKGKGDVAFLKSYAKDIMRVKEIEEITYLGEKISTTRINGAIQNGDLELAHTLLTRPYMMKGKVIHGNAKGRTIGFPTANIELTDLYVMPKSGVYVGKVIIKGHEYKAMINIGHNPTFNEVSHLSIEAHILDFNDIIYDEEITLYLYKFIREEKCFDNIDGLINELSTNVEYTREYFGE